MERRVEQGWIYVLVNSSIPGMAKVGRTSRPPAERVAELSGATGVATPFVLAFDQPVQDCMAAEHAVHAELDRRGLRVAPNREFFRGSPADIIRVVLEAAGSASPAVRGAPDVSVARLLAVGDQHRFGLGDTLQDDGEAIRCYKLAAARGSLDALERLGQLYGCLHASDPSRASRRRAMAPLKEGARRGNPYCYAEMAMLFAGERHVENFVKAWHLFFTRRAAGGESARLAVAICRYIAACLELGLEPGHRETLTGMADQVIATLLVELDAAGSAGPDRQRVVQVLRWAYERLVPEPVLPRVRPRHTGWSKRVWTGRTDIAAA